MTRLRIGFLMPHYSAHSRSHMPQVLRLLGEAGVTVEILNPAERIVNLTDLRVEHDLYVLKKIGRLPLSIAGALHARGAAIVNPYVTSVALRDKIIAFRTLQAAGVPTPATYAVTDPEQLAPLLDAGPLIVKPYQGTCGKNVRVIRAPADLATVPVDRDPIFAQRYHPPQGRDRKLYVIGDRIFGVKKTFPARTEEEKHGEPFTPTPELCDIARRCARAFGIDLCGVDIIESEGQPYVVDMSSIPGFKGVPDAPVHLAKYFHALAERAAVDGLPARRPHAAPTPVRRLAVRRAALELALHALSTTPASPEEVDEVRRLLAETTGAA